ncbi:MAG: stage V sporulation protein AB [Bacillus sp. (in: firmicutes)]
MTIHVISVVFIGLAGGVAVGSGFVAFLTVLGVVPRLTQLTKTQKMLRYYEIGVVAGVICGSLASLNDFVLYWPGITLACIGLLSGLFNGMLAAALTEVLNVLPILAKRIGIHEKIVYLVMAFVFGKIVGSLFQWIYFVDQ